MCYQLIEEMGMLPHIVAHSEQVCRVALCLVENLQPPWANDLNKRLVRAAALLHDITKTRSFDTGEDHALTGKALLVDKRFPEVARIVGQHVRLDAFPRERRLDEAQIVNYADKRVLHDEVVPLERRMAYILERYGTAEDHRKRILHLWDVSRQLEKHLFSHIDFPPQELPRHLIGVLE
jgi:putative nucleotidyltransferase with HDIG domain